MYINVFQVIKLILMYKHCLYTYRSSRLISQDHVILLYSIHLYRILFIFLTNSELSKPLQHVFIWCF